MADDPQVSTQTDTNTSKQDPYSNDPIIKLLRGLVAGVQNSGLAQVNGASNTMAQANQMNQQTNQSQSQRQSPQPGLNLPGIQSNDYTIGNKNPVTGLTDNHADILQGFIDKSIKKHAEDFINAKGVDAAQQLVDAHRAGADAQGQSNGLTPDNNNNNVNPSKDHFVIDGPSKQGNFLGLGRPGNSYVDDKGNVHITQGSGIFSLPKAQTRLLENAGLMQKMAGAEPIQPEKVAQLNRETYGAALEATHQAIGSETQKLNTLSEQYRNEQPNRNFLDVAKGKESKNQENIRQLIENSADNIKNHVQNLRTLVDNRPSFDSKGVKGSNENQESIKGKITGKLKSGLTYSVTQ
jgi:hypothetical protein